jgi:hypothetical protein
MVAGMEKPTNQARVNTEVTNSLIKEGETELKSIIQENMDEVKLTLNQTHAEAEEVKRTNLEIKHSQEVFSESMKS